MRSSELSSWLKSIQSLVTKTTIIIVPGGGEFADKVRELQDTLKFDDLIAHRMALLSMCQYGYLLAGMNTAIQIVEDIEAITSNMDKELPLLWLPTALIGDDTAIPASWDFTSDSIAIWLASQLAAQRLILVKSKELNNDSTSFEKHIENGDLDKGFQRLTDKYQGKVHFMEKSHYQRLTDLVK
jgi:5-(aminomethyl)-3-furanmethanol phosphate kinase